LEKISGKLEQLKNDAEEIQSAIVELRDEEQDAFDNLPESIQGTERGERMEEAVDKLDDADSSAGNIGDSIEEANEYIAEVIEAIEEAMNA
jgi:methyl-accepting chemotaxis protein